MEPLHNLGKFADGVNGDVPGPQSGKEGGLFQGQQCHWVTDGTEGGNEWGRGTQWLWMLFQE